MSDKLQPLPAPGEVVDQETFDQVFAQNMGPYLRIYVQLFLEEHAPDRDRDAALADLYAGFLSSGALMHQGSSRAFGARVYGLAESALPHLGREALSRERLVEST